MYSIRAYSKYKFNREPCSGKEIRIEIKSWLNGSILFEYESVDNTLAKTLHEANLRGAKNAELAIATTRILPQGSIIGWKKCQDGVLVKLRIPAKAKRTHAFGRKCRAEFAKVVDIVGADEAISTYDNSFKYHKGDTVRPKKPFDLDWTDECSSGIHFFITKEEAEAYPI